MKSLKAKFIVVVSILTAVLLTMVSVVDIKGAMIVINRAKNQEGIQKVDGDIKIVKSIINYKFGKLSLRDGILVDENDESIESKNDFISKIGEETNGVVTVFKKKDNNFVRVMTNIKGSDGKSLVGSKLDTSQEAYKALLNDKDYLGEAVIGNKEYITKYEIIKDSSGKTIGAYFVGKAKEDIEKEESSISKSLIMGAFIIGTICVALSIIVVYILSEVMFKGLKKISLFAEKIQKLDVSEDVNPKLLQLNDEIGDVARTMQIAIETLRSFINQTDEISKELADFSDEVLKGMSQLDSSANEVSTVVVQIADGATSQAKDIGEGTEKVENLGDEIIDNKNQIERLNQLMKNVDGLKRAGAKSVEELSNEAIETMKSTNQIQEVIIETNNKAKEIEEDTVMIKEISEQTNLLALNAAIEAQRAGDQGKGFAVVAEEVRNLAEQSNKFSAKIQQTIQELTSKTQDAVETMEKMKAIMDNQNQKVESTTEKFEGISDSIGETEAALSSLTEISNRIDKERETIVEVMQNLSAISEENAASTEEAAASVEEQTSLISDFNEKIRHLDKLSEKMKSNIEKFTI